VNKKTLKDKLIDACAPTTREEEINVVIEMYMTVPWNKHIQRTCKDIGEKLGRTPEYIFEIIESEAASIRDINDWYNGKRIIK
jgi:hypothetical protein